jgi:phosphoglycolate phosphatase
MNLLVDLDGTLVDPRPGIIGSFQYALDRLGARVPPSEELLWVIGPPLRGSFARLLGSADHAEEAVALYRQRYLDGAMYDAVVYAGVAEALDGLAAADCRLFVATSKPHVYARPILRHFGLDRHFAAVYGPELDGTHDSKIDLIAHIAAQEQLARETTVMIGDREFDVTAAVGNGMRAVGVTWGYGSAEELAAAGAAALCDSPARLAAVILGMR